MPNDMDKLAENKLIILYMLYQMDMPMSTAQLVDFAAYGDYMDYFEFQHCITELVNTAMVNCVKIEDDTVTTYSITKEGEDVLRLFSKQIEYEKRASICQYVRKNKQRIKREFEVVANYFYNAENDYIVKCGVYEEDDMLMEINLSVVTKEQAKRIKRNWKENVTELYGKIMAAMIDEQSGSQMQDELEKNFDNNYVSTKYCEEDEE